MQPPSGGYVLKLFYLYPDDLQQLAATFGWLCVETPFWLVCLSMVAWQPPSGGCVLKLAVPQVSNIGVTAATFGWLCVETSSR